MSGRIWQIDTPGALTTVQDLGRDGWRHLGVARAGALDPAQAALANRLVGNPADAAVLELTVAGPTVSLPAPARIALCGADAEMRFEDAAGRTHAIPGGRRVDLPAGRLRFGALRGDLRAWLAVAGGIATAPVLGSRSTDLRGGFGGLDGRALRAGDTLPIGPHAAIDTVAPVFAAHWCALDTHDARTAPIRYVSSSLDIARALDGRTWTVDPRSDRQGLRCAGDALSTTLPEQISAPVAPIQLPPDGHPIVLLADAQTVGGYPRLGHVIAADLPRLAQRRPGDALRFVAIDAATARAAAMRRRGEIARLHWAIDLAHGDTPEP
jgi:5-oxoprolinase (ATP-hydrolysing) subunit C